MGIQLANSYSSLTPLEKDEVVNVTAFNLEQGDKSTSLRKSINAIMKETLGKSKDDKSLTQAETHVKTLMTAKVEYYNNTNISTPAKLTRKIAKFFSEKIGTLKKGKKAMTKIALEKKMNAIAKTEKRIRSEMGASRSNTKVAEPLVITDINSVTFNFLKDMLKTFATFLATRKLTINVKNKNEKKR